MLTLLSRRVRTLPVLRTAFALGSSAQACTRAACRWYTSHYCEENTLRLCRELIGPAEATGVELYVVFISSRARQVPVWCQSLADSEYEPVLWDYHGESSLLAVCICLIALFALAYLDARLLIYVLILSKP